MSARIALATCDKFPALFDEERSLPARLRALGVDASVQIWSDPAVDWRAFSRVVIRATWDYVERIDEFRAWLGKLDALGVALLNPLPLVRWNLDKRYLRELAARGIATLPTRFVEGGERLDLAKFLAERGWPEAVLKPAVAAGAHRTARFAAADAARFQSELDDLARTSAALVQPFAQEIQAEGEWSLLFFGGEFSHAVLKRPAARDFRVQGNFGGQDTLVSPAASLIDDARAVIACFPAKPAYVRVDGIRRDGKLVLMEAEAIEPYLYCAKFPAGLDRYAAAIAEAVGCIA